MKTEVSTATESVIAGYCIECGELVEGKLSVQFIETCEGAGLQAFISTDDGLHPLARFKRDRIPTVPFDVNQGVASA